MNVYIINSPYKYNKISFHFYTYSLEQTNRARILKSYFIRRLILFGQFPQRIPKFTKIAPPHHCSCIILLEYNFIVMQNPSDLIALCLYVRIQSSRANDPFQNGSRFQEGGKVFFFYEFSYRYIYIYNIKIEREFNRLRSKIHSNRLLH